MLHNGIILKLAFDESLFELKTATTDDMSDHASRGRAVQGLITARATEPLLKPSVTTHDYPLDMQTPSLR
jgi:hypothetical protein